MSDLLARTIVDALRHREFAVRRDDWDVVVVRHPRTARTVATIAIRDGRPTLDSADDLYRPGLERALATALDRAQRERQRRRQRGAA